MGLLDALVAPASAAYGHISVIATDLYLRTFFHNIAFRINTGIDYGLMAAVACRFYLVDGIGYLEKTS